MGSKDNTDPKELPLVAHLIELRDRIVRSLICVAILFLLLFHFTNDIFVIVAEPIMHAMVPGQQLIVTKPLDTFIIPYMLTFMVAFFISIPFVMHQIWAFVAPGLYQNEVKVTLPILVSSVLLFYVGMAFAYFMVLPLIFKFSVSQTPDNVAMMTDISYYYDLVMRMFMVFGFVFEVPVATVLLILAGVISPAQLAQHRGYVIIGCFTVGMLVTPPDVFSQSMVAIPMWMLFESGLLAGRLLKGKEDAAAKAKESQG